MTIDDLISAGIELQGNDIRVRIYDDTLETYSLNRKLELMSMSCEEIQNREIKYIYVENSTLVFELASEN